MLSECVGPDGELESKATCWHQVFTCNLSLALFLKRTKSTCGALFTWRWNASNSFPKSCEASSGTRIVLVQYERNEFIG